MDLGSIYNLLLQVSKTVSGHDAKLERHSQALERQAVAIRQMQTFLEEVKLYLNEAVATKSDLAGLASKADLDGLGGAVKQYHGSIMGTACC